MKVNYNKSEVMSRAWKLFNGQEVKTDDMFSICLKESWRITKSKGKLDFNSIYKEYHQPVLNRLKMKVRNVEVCEELCNDIFLKVNEYLNIFNSERAKFSTWLFKFVDNKIIDYYRGEGKKADQLVNTSDFVDSEGSECFTFVGGDIASIEVESQELSLKIGEVMNNLKPKYREIADLYYYQQKQYKEIAEILNIPMSNVKVTIMRAKLMLQKALQKDYAMLG